MACGVMWRVRLCGVYMTQSLCVVVRIMWHMCSASYTYVPTYIHTVPCCSAHRLGRDVCGRVKFANLADGFVEKPLEQFSVGDVVKAKVLE